MMGIKVCRCCNLLAAGREAGDILRELMAMDYAALPMLRVEDEGSFEQWLPLVLRQDSQARYLVAPNGKIVGYWHIEALSDVLIELFEQGVLRDSDLHVGNLLKMDKPGKLWDLFCADAFG